MEKLHDCAYFSDAEGKCSLPETERCQSKNCPAKQVPTPTPKTQATPAPEPAATYKPTPAPVNTIEDDNDKVIYVPDLIRKHACLIIEWLISVLFSKRG